MNEYILLMHDDVDDRAVADDGAQWDTYIRALRQSGRLHDGSVMGAGLCVKKHGVARNASQLTGYMRVRAESHDDAKLCLNGNPVHEAGGTVEICELLKD